MLCSSCGHENREGKRFCVECGTALALQCPSCASPVDAGQKFCGECGTRLTDAPAATPATAPAAVRKTVTVLFADLGGSTGFGERTDAEIAREVLARYHALLQETIDAHAGTVAKFMGDGMMATFGIPEVAEDDAHRAVAAGTSLQQRFGELAADIERRHGEALTLRVGINTGEVVIGEGDADVIGDALNVAARLEKACRPGHVLVGEETWRLTRSGVAYEALGEVTVAGRARPVAVYEVATEAETAEEVAAPFVGRQPEMDRLLAVLDDARAASAARLATVLGSPGVGKTRLSRELCTRADAQSVELRCDRAGGATFAPVAQLIRESAGLADDADADAARAAIGTLLPQTEADHARVVEMLAGLVGAAPARSVEETFWAVRRLVEATAATRPLVIVIDDIQWAAPLLLDLIEHLAEWVAGAAVLLLGLARPELRDVRPSLAEPGRPVADVVVLDGLDPSATEALAAGLLGTDRLPAGLVERLPESTDGNPLFVRELVRMLIDDRVVRRRDDGQWELTIDAEAVDVPPTIQSLLGARVERLPAAERELLELASVVGAEFSHGALRELAGDRVAVAPLLEAMRRKELVEPTGTYWGDEPVFRFHHVLIRDAAYRRLLKTTRADLHERVAEWTDRNAATLIGEHEAAVAFHYEQAYGYRVELGALDGRADDLARRGAELLTIAAQRALGRDDLTAAGALSARALALLPESDAAARADLLTMGCESLLASGNGTAARPLVEELGRVSRGADRLEAWAECFAAQLVGLTDPDGLVAADARAAVAADRLTALGDGSGQAKAHQVRAGLLARLGRVGDAEQELELALAAAREVDDRRRVTAVLGAAPDAALFGPSPVARAGGRCLDVVRLLRITTASPSVEAASNRCQAVLEALRGRFDVSRSMLTAARSTLEELGLRHGLAQTELYAGMVELIAADPHAAIPPLRAAFDGLDALGVGADAGIAASLLARALLVDGRVAEADEMAAAGEQLAGQNLKTAIGWRVARAEVLAARGDGAGAVELAERAVEIAAGTDLVIDHADACVALAALRAQTGDGAGARAARTDAKRLYDQKGATVLARRLGATDAATKGPRPPVATEPASDDRATPAIANRATSLSTGLLENTASRVYAAVMDVIAARADGDLAELIASGFIYDDRRSVVNYGVSTLAGAAEQVQWLRDEGFRMAVPDVVAVRGDRFALTWNDTRTSAGDDISSFAVVEVDKQSHLATMIQYNDLAPALTELDARYIAGEAAEHADLVRMVAAWIDVFETGEVETIRDLVTPDFVWVDHQRLGWGTLDVDQIIELFRELHGVQNAVVVAREVVVGPCILFTAANHATDAAGGEVLWSFHAVGTVDDSGRTTRVEIFAEDDGDAAQARLDELGGAGSSDSGPPVLENTASRVDARVIALFAAGADRELADLAAPEFAFDDRRSVVSSGVSGKAEVAPEIAWIREQGFHVAMPQTIAIRGDRLVLSRRNRRTPAGDEVASLAVVEVDGQSRLRALVQFDEEDLDDAVAELDARYAADEGAEHADILAAGTAWFRAMGDRDFDRIRELVAPGTVFVDRRLLGAPQLDLDGFIEWQRGYVDVPRTFLVAQLRVAGRVGFVTVRSEGVDADGGIVEWTFLGVGTFDAEGRYTRVETFAEDDLDAALARFSALSSTDSRTPLVENAASRLYLRSVLANMSDADHELGNFIAPAYRWDDRRSGVNFGENDLAGAAAHIRYNREQGFDFSTTEAIAVRGDRLSLSRTNNRYPEQYATASLALAELDEQGRLARTTHFDEDALDTAIAELDARYLAGEGAAHAELLTRANADIAAAASADLQALRSRLDPDFTLVDHRAASWGTRDRDGYVAMQQIYADVVRSFLVKKVLFAERTLLATAESRGVDADGSDFEWTFHSLTVWNPDGRAVRAEVFDDHDWEAALARFDELSATEDRSALRPVENAATRATRDSLALLLAGRYDDLRTTLRADFERIDRRHGVAGEPIGSAADYITSLRAILNQFETLSSEPIAVRGDRFHLSRVVWGRMDDFHVTALVVFEFDGAGLGVANITFEEDDLPTAMYELDRRYLVEEGAEHAWIGLPGAEFWHSYNVRDWDRARRHLADEMTVVDHRLLSSGTTLQSSDELIEYMTAMIELVPNLIAFDTEHLRIGHRAALSRHLARGTSREGAAVELETLVINEMRSGLFVRSETFGPEQLEEAVARFDEIETETEIETVTATATAPTADGASPGLSNASTRFVEMVTALVGEERFDEAEPSFADGYVCEDRHTVAGWPTAHGGREFLSFWHSFSEVGFNPVVFEFLAVRGERLQLGRATFETDDGQKVVFLAVGELDESGRAIASVNFDEDNLTGAIDELDQRYLAGEGAEHAAVLQPFVEYWRSYNARDWDRALTYVTDDFTFDDRGPIGAGSSVQNADQFLEFQQGLIDQVPDLVAYESEHLAVGRAWILSRHVARGTSTHGAYISTEHLTLTEVRDGRSSRAEAFEVDQLDEARARFTELEAEA